MCVFTAQFSKEISIDGTEPTCTVGDLGSIPESVGSPGGGNSNSLQYSWLANLHGQRSLAGCRPWGCKEWEMTEQRLVCELLEERDYVLNQAEGLALYRS